MRDTCTPRYQSTNNKSAPSPTPREAAYSSCIPTVCCRQHFHTAYDEEGLARSLNGYMMKLKIGTTICEQARSDKQRRWLANDATHDAYIISTTSS